MKIAIVVNLAAWMLFGTSLTQLMTTASVSTPLSSMRNKSLQASEPGRLIQVAGDDREFLKNIVEILVEVELNISCGPKVVLEKVAEARTQLDELGVGNTAEQALSIYHAYYSLKLTESWANRPFDLEPVSTDGIHIPPVNDLGLIVSLAQARCREHASFFDICSRTWSIVASLSAIAENQQLKTLAFSRLYHHRWGIKIPEEELCKRMIAQHEIAPTQESKFSLDYLEVLNLKDQGEVPLKTYQNRLASFIDRAVEQGQFELAWQATLALLNSEKTNVDLSIQCLRQASGIAKEADSGQWEADTYYLVIESLYRKGEWNQAVEVYFEFKNSGLEFKDSPLKISDLASRAYAMLRKLGRREEGKQERDLIIDSEASAAITAKQQEEARKRSEEISKRLQKQEKEMILRLDELSRELKENEKKNAELQKKNAELQAEHAGLQMLNAELQTENAELQTVNAELQTVNADFQNKSDQFQKEFSFLRSRTEFLGWLAGLITLIACLIALVLWLNNKFRLQAIELLEQEKNVNELNSKLSRMKRMDSLGLMAGSIAHDFNNILVGVTGNADLIELSREMGNFNEDFVRDRVAAIQVSAARAQKLAKQMLSYAGKQHIAQKVVDLNELVRGYEPVMSSFSRKDHRVVLELDKQSLTVKVDETQIEQALFNLVTNAINLSPGGSRVWVRTSKVVLTDEDMADPSLFGSRQTGGEFGCIEIEDEGCGIAPHQLDKIFEPYFSESGTGRGLGLAVVHGVIESHLGAIRCVSTYGEGATFQLLLPLSSEVVSEFTDGHDSPSTPSFAVAHAGKRILIIDDEASVLDTCEQLFTQLGLVSDTVWVRGEECLNRILEKLSSQSFDCILMDVVMPELSGTQVLDVLEDREIETPVVLMSGFSPERLDFYQKRRTVAAILPKPFGIPDLIQSIVIALTPRRLQQEHALGTALPESTLRKHGRSKHRIDVDQVH